MEEKVAEEWKKEMRGKSRIPNFFANLTVPAILIILVVVIILISVSKQSTDKSYIYVGYGGLLAIILYLMFRKGPKKELISERVAKKIAQACLERKRMEGKEIGQNDPVFTDMACHLAYDVDVASQSMIYTSWVLGFHILQEGRRAKEGIIRVHPYDGIVIGIEWMPFGYLGNEVKNNIYVPVLQVPGSMKTTDFAGNKPN